MKASLVDWPSQSLFSNKDLFFNVICGATIVIVFQRQPFVYAMVSCQEMLEYRNGYVAINPERNTVKLTVHSFQLISLILVYFAGNPLNP